MDHNARPAQISPAIYSPAAQRRAVRSRAEPYGALPRPSLRCCVVLRCVLSFEHRAVPGIIRVVVMCYFSSFFFFYIHVFDLSRAPVFPPMQITNYPRTADQNLTPVTKAHSTSEHNRAPCSAQAALGIIKSLFAPNHGPPSFCPLYMFFVAFFLALRERSGQRQPPAERSPCRLYIKMSEVSLFVGQGLRSAMLGRFLIECGTGNRSPVSQKGVFFCCHPRDLSAGLTITGIVWAWKHKRFQTNASHALAHLC